MTNGPYGLPEMPLTLDAFERLAGFGFLGWSPGNLYTLLRSLWQTLLSTTLVVLVAYPIATTSPPAENAGVRSCCWRSWCPPGPIR